MECQPPQSLENEQTQSSVKILTTTDLPTLCNFLYRAANKCYDIGLQLGVKSHEIRIIEHNFKNDCKRQLSQILENRLNQDSHLTWPDIVVALRSDSVEEYSMANEIEAKFMNLQAYTSLSLVPSVESATHQTSAASPYPGSYIQPHETPSPHANPRQRMQFDRFVEYVKYVKVIYQSSVVQTDLEVTKWPITPTKEFINLVSIDRESLVNKEEADDVTRAMVLHGDVDVIMKKKKPIDFEDIVKDLPEMGQKRVIVVEGAPGVGKSTFAWEFCRRWERGEIAQQFLLVLLLRLRDKRISEAKSLNQLLYHPLNATVEAVEQELVDIHGARALFILEGYDELPQACRSKSSFLVQLISGELLPKAAVLVTSRPWATTDLHYYHKHRIFRYIEILGFSSSQITAYIESTVSEELVQDFRDYLIKHPQMQSCMYIPLNSAIVVKVYEESIAGRCSLPRTSTELYTALAIILLLRHMHGKEKYGNMTAISSFNELPQEVHEQFLQICEVAYDGIAADDGKIKITFNDLPLHFENLGFMDSVTEVYITKGEITSHNFLHLTIQEYLAAVHISKMSPCKLLQHFEHRDGRYEVVLKFLAGITKFNGLSVNAIQYSIESDNCVLQYVCDPYTVHSNVVVQKSLITWLFEAQSGDLISELLADRVLYFEDNVALPLDYYSLGYCIVHSSSQWTLALQGEKMEADMRMLVAGASTRKESAARVVGLLGTAPSNTGNNFDCCLLDISTNGLDILFAGMQHVLCLKELWLELLTECSSIAWPDLSQIRVLHLGIRQELSLVKLDTLLCIQLLESLTVINRGYRLYSHCICLNMEGYIVLANLLSSNQSTNVDISDHEYHITKIKPKTLKKVINSRSQTSFIVQMNLSKLTGNESLGYVIANSSCQWTLELCSGYCEYVESTEREEEMKRFVTAASSNNDTCAQIVNLRGRYDDSPLIVSVNTLHMLFTDMKHMLSLEELSLQLPVDCSCIAWPDLSRLRVLHLGISGKRNWKLSSLLSRLTLDTLKIEVTNESLLCLQDCIAIGDLLSPSKCPNNVYIEVPNSFCVRTNIKKGNVPFNKKPSSLPLIEMVVYNCLSGYNIIAYSSSQWILTFDSRFRGKVNSDNIITEATSRINTSARIMGLRSGSYSYVNKDYEFQHQLLSLSAKSLNVLFKETKHMLSLEKLSLQLPVDCSCIAWPDLSRLRVLHLGIRGERNWKLSSLLPHLTLDTLNIKCTPSNSRLCQEDFIALGQFLSPSKCPSNMFIEISATLNIQVVKQSLNSANKNLNVSQLILEMKILNNEFHDYMGYCIAHSNCHWIVTFNNVNKKDLKRFAAGASSRLDTSARVVGLRGREKYKLLKSDHQPLSISAEKLNVLFTDMKHMLSLEELSLQLPVDCSCIAWPDLSRLRVLHLGISGERNWKLSSLLPRLTLDSLEITGTYLCLDDSITIGELLSPSKCPKNIYIDISNRYSIRKDTCRAKAIEGSLVFVKKESNALLVELKLLYIDSEDYLGSCIAHSSCQWILTIDCKRRSIKALAAAIGSNPETVAKVVVLRAEKHSECFGETSYLQDFLLSTEDLNALFTGTKHILSLEKLSLQLPVDCSCIAWPDLSRLRVLHLGISGERNWKLSSLLPRLTLDSLEIESSSKLCLEDYICIGQLLSFSRCPKNICISIIHNKNCITKCYHVNNIKLLLEMKICNDECLDFMSYCIAHSRCQWILTLPSTSFDFEALPTGASVIETSARVVELKGGNCLLVTAKSLNALFKYMKHMLSLEKLSLQLSVECSCIAWPDLSLLRVLHLGISGKRDWKFRSLLPHLTLDSLKITSMTTTGCVLCVEDSIAVGEFLSSSRCLKRLDIQINYKYNVSVRKKLAKTQDYLLGKGNKSKNVSLLGEVVISGDINQENLGYLVAHSSCHWIFSVEYVSADMLFNIFAVEASLRPETRAQVVGLRGGYFRSKHLVASTEILNALFKETKHMLSLEELSLQLPVDCSCIAWPDLSRLRVLHLGISGERNWKLSSLLPHLTLDTLTLTAIASSERVLCLEDCIAIGEILSPCTCPKVLCVAIKGKCKITSLQLQESTSIDTNSQSVEMVLFDNENQDYLGYCIAHSSCQWILTLSLTEEQNLKALATGIMSRPDTSARVVGLRGGRYESPTKEGEMGSDYNEEKEENVHPLLASAEALNSLFTDVKHVMKLEELSLRLPVDCSHIVWPDLSGIKELHLQISSQQNWKLDTILRNIYSSLRCFRIDCATNDTQLLYEDCMAIANYLSSSNCLEQLHFGYTENSSPLVIQSITPIVQAIAKNQSLALLDLICNCKFSFTDVKDLASFIERSTALQHLSIGWCVFDIRDFLDLSRLVYHGSQLPEAEKSFNNISLNVDGNEEIQLFTQLLADYPAALSLNTVSFSRVHDGGVKEVASALVQRYDLIRKTHSSVLSVVDTLNWWDNSSSDDEECNHKASPRALNLSSNCISNDGIAALVPAFCHDNCSLEQLNLSNNRISDDGVAIIAESLHHCRGLSVLDLSSNNITDVGAVAIAKRLHVATKLGKLDLSNNSISDEGTTALAQAFNHTTELKVLNLSANSAVGRRGMNKLVKALSIKKSLAYDIILPWQCKIYSDDCYKVKQCITFESENNDKDKHKVRERIERGRSKKRKRSSERTGRNRKMSTEMRRCIERSTERWRGPGRRGRERFSSIRDRRTEGNCTGRRRERWSSEDRSKWWASEEKGREMWPSEVKRKERWASEERRRVGCPNEAIRDRQRQPSEDRKKERWPSEERMDRERQESEATRDRERWPSKERRRERWKSTASRDRERGQSEARRDRERWQSEARRDRERWPSASEERRDRERWQSEVRWKRWRSKERSRESWQTEQRGSERWRSTEIGKERRSARKMQWNSSTERSRERGQSTKRRKDRSTQRKDSTGRKRKRSMERPSEEYIKRKSSTAGNKKRESSTARKKEKSAERRSRERERRTPVHEKGGQCGEKGEMEREKRSRARH